MSSEEETMADAVTSIIEGAVHDTSVTGGSCGSWCSDATYSDSWSETWSESV